MPLDECDRRLTLSDHIKVDSGDDDDDDDDDGDGDDDDNKDDIYMHKDQDGLELYNIFNQVCPATSSIMNVERPI